MFAGDKLPAANEPEALIVIGKPLGVGDAARHPWLAHEKRFPREVIGRDIPILGICLGAQLIALRRSKDEA